MTSIDTVPKADSVFSTIADRLRHGTKGYDLLVAAPVILWYVFCQYLSLVDLLHSFQQAAISHHEWRFGLRLISRLSQLVFGFLLIVLLLARRPPIAGQTKLVPRVIALLGTYMGIALVVMPVHKHGSPWLALSAFLMFFGMAFSVWSLAWLGRSFSMMPESRKLVDSGPYSLVRHPLYLGEQIALVGVALECTTLWALATIVLQFCCQLYRMNYEEDILSKSFPEYEAYMARTSRFIPWLY